MRQCLYIQILDSITGFPDSLKKDGKIFLDLSPGFRLEESKNVSELTDIEEITDEAVLSFSIPYSPTNDILAERLVNPNLIGNKKTPYSILIQEDERVLNLNELEFISASDANKEYEVRIKRSTEHWLRKAAQTKLNEIDYGSFTLSTANITSNWANDFRYSDGDTGVYFPIVDYGGWFNVTQIIVNDLRPWYHLTGILQKGFLHMGWNFSCPLLETNEGRQIIAYLSDDDFGKSIDQAQNNTFLGVMDAATINAQPNYPSVTFGFNVELKDPGDNYNGVNFYARGVFDFYAEVDGSIDASGATVTLKIKVFSALGDREVAQTVDVEGDFSLRLELKGVLNTSVTQSFIVVENNGDVTIVRGSFYNEPVRFLANKGDTISLSDYLSPNYTFLELFKGVLHLFNGKVVTDWLNRKVSVYTPYNAEFYGNSVDGFYTNEVDDLTDRIIDDSQEVALREVDIDRYQLLSFSDSTDKYIRTLNYPKDSPPLSKTVDLGSEYSNTTEKNDNPFFEPTLNRASTNVSGLTFPIDVPALWDNDNGLVSFDLGPRLCYTPGQVHQVAVASAGNEYRQFVFEATGFNTVPYAYQVAQTSGGTTGTPSAYPDRLTYADVWYDSGYKQTMPKRTRTANYSYLCEYDAKQYKEENFRDLKKINYGGRIIMGRLQSIDGRQSCDDSSPQIIIIPEQFERE